jgi:hypothetical protein
MWFPYFILSLTYIFLEHALDQPEKALIGKLAFSIFSLNGSMSHPINDPVAGVEPSPSPTPEAGLAMLVHALQDFDAFNGDLKDHFAYGALDKEQYTRAHLMHIDNHLRFFNNEVAKI